jgi:hypothetical protein
VTVPVTVWAYALIEANNAANSNNIFFILK